MSEQLRVIIIMGTMGAGKTTVMAEALDILSGAGITPAAIHIDALGMSHIPSMPSDFRARLKACSWAEAHQGETSFWKLSYRESSCRAPVRCSCLHYCTRLDSLYGNQGLRGGCHGLGWPRVG